MMKIVSAAALLLASPLVAGHGIPPDLDANEKPCSSMMLKKFLTCAYITDFNATSGEFADPSACGDDFDDAFQACRGGFWYLAEEDEFFDGSTPVALAGTVTKAGGLSVLYSLPGDFEDSKIFSTHNKTSKHVSSSSKVGLGGLVKTHKLDCKACQTFAKRVLQCAMPVTTDGNDLDSDFDDALEGCVDIEDPNDQFLATVCGFSGALGPFGATWAPLEEVDGEIDYVYFTPMLIMEGFSQTCGAVEASHSDKSGAVKVTMDKEGISFWGKI